MKKRTRRALFWIAVVLFASASWVAIRYAQGYAYDFKTGSFVRTGAVVVTVNTGAALTIDGRKVGDTSFIGNRVGSDGLVPGTYDVMVTREGYSSWRKSAAVEEGKLTDFPHVLILPADDESLLALKDEASRSLTEARTLGDAPVPSPAPKPPRPSPTPSVTSGAFTLRGTSLYFDDGTASGSLVAERVLGFSVADDSSRTAWWTRNEVWVLWTRNTDDQPYRTEMERQMVTRFSVAINGVAWFRGRDHVVIDLGNQSYRIAETDNRGGTNIIKL